MWSGSAQTLRRLVAPIAATTCSYGAHRYYSVPALRCDGSVQLSSMRKDYSTDQVLDEKTVGGNPFPLFEKWLNEVRRK